MCECKNIDKLMNEIAFYRDEIEELKERNMKLYNSNETLRALLKKKDRRISELHDTIDNLARENEALRERADRTIDDASDLYAKKNNKIKDLVGALMAIIDIIEDVSIDEDDDLGEDDI